jgi:hypothetical protein
MLLGTNLGTNSRNAETMREAEQSEGAIQATGLSLAFDEISLNDVLSGRTALDIILARSSNPVAAGTFKEKPVPKVSAPEEKPGELLMLKPNFHGIGIDLKEAARRLRRCFKNGSRSQRRDHDLNPAT